MDAIEQKVYQRIKVLRTRLRGTSETKLSQICGTTNSYTEREEFFLFFLKTIISCAEYEKILRKKERM